MTIPTCILTFIVALEYLYFCWKQNSLPILIYDKTEKADRLERKPLFYYFECYGGHLQWLESTL